MTEKVRLDTKICILEAKKSHINLFNLRSMDSERAINISREKTGSLLTGSGSRDDDSSHYENDKPNPKVAILLLHRLPTFHLFFPLSPLSFHRSPFEP